MTRQVVLATRNPRKLAELRRILGEAGLAVELVGLPEGAPDVAETGRTFAENALLKARGIAAATGTAAVADDSGLCVDALRGMPGVLSARWAGRHGDDRANLELLLGQLDEVPDDRRAAHFACAAAAVVPGAGEHVAEGRLDGTIVRSPRGTNGFGYDPVFCPDGSARTTAELQPEEKDAISHRGQAFRSLVPFLERLLAAAPDSSAAAGFGTTGRDRRPGPRDVQP